LIRILREGYEEAAGKLFQALASCAICSDAGVDREAEPMPISNYPHPSNDPVAVKLLDHVRVREAVCKQLALKVSISLIAAVAAVDEGSAAARARVRPGSVVYLHLALEKWTAGL